MNTNQMISKITIAILGLLLMTGCTTMVGPVKSDPAQLGYKSAVHDDLISLPEPNVKIVVGVYKFRDQTGQYKSGTPITTYSTAVTQGATSMLIKALEDAGRGKWFSVLERESLPNLLNERKIIRQTRKQYLSKDAQGKIEPLPPLLYAPIMLDGGVISYETNLLTGGVGARYFGAGGSTEFRRDTVTIYLRAVSVKNGQIVKSVLTNKTIFSMEIDAGLFRFVSFKKLLEVEMGLSTNEPPQMAVLESIEKAVYSLIMEGVVDGLWGFRDPKQGVEKIKSFLKEKDPTLSAEFNANGQLVRVRTASNEQVGNPIVRPVTLPKPSQQQDTSKKLIPPQDVSNKNTILAPAAETPAIEQDVIDATPEVKDYGSHKSYNFSP
jgi:curli production assembly/transport component CsgG